MMHSLLFLALLASTGQTVLSAEESSPSISSEHQQAVTAIFIVVWTMDYGYALYKPDDLDHQVIPEFANPNALQSFDSFDYDNLHHIGKRIVCDCTGETYVRDGVQFFRISSAQVHAIE